MIEKAEKILILSGEGDNGTFEVYTGKRTERALKARLTKERCHGDRWARALAHCDGDTYVELDKNLQPCAYSYRTVRESDI